MNHVGINVGLAGRYRLQVLGPDGEVRRDTGWFNNLILDAGLNRIGSGSLIASHCHVGAGSATPTVANTSLQSFIASSGSVQSTTNGLVDLPGEKYGWCARRWRFAAGAAAGNVSEVGIAWSSSNGNLFSRALVVDEFGDPNTITVLSDEVLDVIYELRLYPPTTDTPFTLTIAGVEYTGVARAANVASGNWTPDIMMINGMNYSVPMFYAYQGPIGAISTTPAGSSSPASLTFDAYSNNSLQRTGIATFGLTAGNLSGGIGAFYLFVYANWNFQFSVTPKIPKDSSKILTLRVTTTWARKTI